jgi:hypothetical protein
LATRSMLRTLNAKLRRFRLPTGHALWSTSSAM